MTDMIKAPAFVADNDGISIRLRRYHDILAFSGGVVIVLTVWDIIKFFLTLFLGDESVKEFMTALVTELSADLPDPKWVTVLRIVAWLVFLGILVLACLITSLYHLYIGLSAYRIGHRFERSNKRFYLILVGFSIVFSGFTLALSTASFIFSDNVDDRVGFATLLLELTSFLNYVFLLRSAMKIKSLEKAGGRIK